MSYEAWRREVALGRMPDWDEERNDYVGGSSHGGPRVWVCAACGVHRWEDEMVQRGAHNTTFCEACDPLKHQEFCEACGFDARSCACDRRQP